MKIGVSISLALIILFEITGSFLLFKWQQTEIRQEIKMKIKSGVPKSDLVVLNFNYNPESGKAEDLTWLKKNEFIFNGQLYDIVQQSVTGNTISYFCIPDFKESALFKNLNKMLNNELAKDRTNSGSTPGIVMNWFFLADDFHHFDIFEGLQAFNLSDHFISKSWQLFTYYPPPRFFIL